MSRHFHTSINSNDPLLKAAFELAENAHRGQRRGKALPPDKDPYLIHPVMVYELLLAMGEKDPAMLAAGLLHDTLEDYPTYEANPAQLKTDLTAALQRHGYRGDMGVVDEVFAIVQELTKPKQLVEGSKRITQVHRAAGMRTCAKIIKIADQMCSHIDHLMMANDPEMFSGQKSKEFALKANNLVQAILHSATTVEERLRIAPWFGLYHFIYTYHQELLDAKSQSEIDAIRKAFDRPVADILNMDPRYEVFAAKKVPMRLDRSQTCTLAHVNLDAYGNVQNFVLWVNPNGDGEDPRNRRQRALLDALEKHPAAKVIFGQRRAVTFGDGATAEEGRIHYLEPHMPVADFLMLAKQTHVTGLAGAHLLEAAARELHKSNGQRSTA